MARKNVTQKQSRFSQIPAPQIQRSSFNRSSSLKTTFDAGWLIPIWIDEVLPGDTFNLKMSTFGRLATPLHPTMDNIYLDFFFFFVPNRLLWDNWQKFNGEQKDPGDSTDFEIPQVTMPAAGYVEGTLFDYLGLPTQVVPESPVRPGIDSHCAFWSRAYNFIWNEWFRDENLADSKIFDTDDGPDDPTNYILERRMKRHDYFTSALPFPQKGPSVTLPLGISAPTSIFSTGDGFPTFDAGTATNTRMMTQVNEEMEIAGTTSTTGDLEWNDPKLAGLTDLTGATAATINELRIAFQVQRLYERDARGGTRYTEMLKSHFGVTSPDFRLQRPEYLGGGNTMVQTYPVPQTGETSVDSPQGNLAAYSTFANQGPGFTKSFVEHGVIVGLVSGRADYHYQQGLDRMFSRLTRWDFYWPTLAHLGEQEVLNAELFYAGDTADIDVFGYQERYAEYRYKVSKVTGLFRSNAAASLDSWHLAEDFIIRPALDKSFMSEAPPIDRIIAVQTEPHFILDCFFDLKCARPMPVYSVPGLIDHF